MNRDKFKTLIIRSAFTRRKSYEDFLNSMPLLNVSLSQYELSQVADSLNTFVFKPGECIFKQNDEADGMYFIESGKVIIIHDDFDQSEEKESVRIRILKKGEFFGELALGK
jgi:cAMP-dependent protein kinase regulator